METPQTNKSEQAPSCKDRYLPSRRARGMEYVRRLSIPTFNKRPCTSTGSGANTSLRLYILRQLTERLRKEGAQLERRTVVNVESMSALAREIDAVCASNAAFCGRFQGEDSLERLGKRQHAGKKKWKKMVLGY